VACKGVSNPSEPADREVAFHLDGVIDAVNVELRADGTYRASSNGCDVSSSGRGRWEPEGAMLSFLPPAGESSVYWPWSGFNGKSAVRAIVVPGGFVVREIGSLQHGAEVGRGPRMCGL
jgi:hypothetical protein